MKNVRKLEKSINISVRQYVHRQHLAELGVYTLQGQSVNKLVTHDIPILNPNYLSVIISSLSK